MRADGSKKRKYRIKRALSKERAKNRSPGTRNQGKDLIMKGIREHNTKIAVGLAEDWN